MALNIKIILLVSLGGAIASFLIQNVESTEIEFLFWSVTMHRSTLILLVLGIGVIIGWVLHSIQTRTRKRREDTRLLAQPLPDSNGGSRKSELIDSD